MKHNVLKNGAALFIVLSLFAQMLMATTSIDQSLDVGAIDGAHSVNLSGAFTYTIPIKIPEGTMGLQPNLSLNYNSQGGNGMAGYGWNLGGLSAISRVNKSIYYDGEVGAPDLGYEDALALDGNRIFFKATLDNGKYRGYYSEIESFQRILTANDDKLTEFTVETKDGKTIEYGHTDNARLKTVDGLATLSWYINKVTDRNGNSMTYHYTQYGRQKVLSRIEYTGNGTTKPHSKVFFNYSDRTDKSHAYIAGSKVEQYKLLESIVIQTNCTSKKPNGQHYKSYQLLYEEDHFSYLTEFQEWGSAITDTGTERLNSLTFEYDGQEDYNKDNYSVTKLNISENEYAGLANTDIVVIPGNFNGDGLQDFLTLEYEKTNDKGKYIGVALQLNNNKGNTTGFTTINLINKIVNEAGNFSLMRYLQPTQNLKNFNTDAIQPIAGIQTFTGDLNNDNIDDIIIYDHNITTYRFFESIGIGEYKLNAKEIKVSDNSTATLIDVDGDNLLELFIVERADGIINDRNELHLQSFDNRYDLNCYSYGDVNLNPAEINLNPKDYDGDGKMELEIVQNKTALGTIRHLFVFKSDLRNQTEPDLCDFIQSASFDFDQQYTTWGDYRNNPMHFKSLISDFNGDGKDDELILNEINQQVELKLNTKLNSQKLVTHNIPFLSKPENKLYSADLNADGLTDCFYTQNGTPDKIRFFINKGEGENFEEFTYSHNNGELFTIDQDIVQFADFDGDGAIEIFFKRPTTFYPRILKLNFGKSKNRLLKKVQDSFAKETTIDYLLLSSEQNYRFLPESEFSLSYPYRKISTPIQVVHQVNIPINSFTKGVKEYAYENLIVHLQGKGILGFEKITETDQLNKLKTESTFTPRLSVPVLMLPDKTYVSSFDDDPNTEDIKISENASIYSFQYNSTVKNHRMYISQTTGIDHTNQSKTITKLQNYDGYGNPQKSITEVFDMMSTPEALELTTTENVTYYNCDWWANYLPQKITTNLNRKDYTAIKTNARTIHYSYYDDVKANLKTETTDSLTDNRLLTKYTNLDKFGNPKTTSWFTDEETEGRSSSLTFDATGRYVTAREDSQSNTVETTVPNLIWGLPASITDINGNTAAFTYDNYGRLQTSTDYLGNTGNTTYDWIKPNNPPESDYDFIANDYNIVSTFLVSNNTPNAPNTTAYFDNFGREVLADTEQFEDQKAYSFKKYDVRGRLTDESGSFRRGDDEALPTLNSFTYDFLNRMKTSVVKQYYQNSLGNLYTLKITEQVNYHYPTRMVQVLGTEKHNSDIMFKNSTFDATGKLEKVEDAGGSLTYKYNNFNELYTVEDENAQILTRSEYDDFGRQTALIDLNAGTTSYLYNPFDELISQTDAKGNTTTMVYDNLGRIESKQLSDAGNAAINYVYTYYEASENGALQLKSESGPNGYITSYTYDGKGRLTSTTNDLSVEQFTTSQTYNNYGDIETITYPNNFTIAYEYDQDTGILTEGKNGTTVIYEMTGTNHLGQITDYTYSNGTMPVKHTYNELGMPATSQAKNNTNTTIFNRSYNFNKTNGNLNQRIKILGNNTFLTENFGYDHLHRLTHVGNEEVVKYAANGNIDIKEDAGTYAYHQPKGKINAVSSITNENENIPLLTEQIGYTSFDRPKSILEDGKGYILSYGAQHQRLKTTFNNNGQETTRYYSGNYELLEEDGQQTSIYYLSFANSVDAIFVKKGNNAGELYYTFTDYLGSILKVTDDTGFVYEAQSFDAWGKKRNPQKWTEVYDAAEAKPIVLTWLNRGYTGHEHLYEFGLINMNNRLYDPIVGRMLAVDNFVADSESTQAFNRYSYAMNNPLKYTDPSGDIVIAPILIGVAIGAYSGIQVGKAQGATGLDLFGYAFLGGVIGGAAGFVGGGVAASIGQNLAFAGAGTVGAATGGAIGGAISGGGFAAIGGGNAAEGIWKGAVSGLIGGAIGAYVGGGIGAFTGGFSSSSLNSALYGADLGESIISGLAGGLTAFGSYQISSYTSYKKTQQSEWMSFKQYKAISSATQRSFSRGKEFGGWLLDDGSVEMWKPGTRSGITPTPKPKNVLVSFHTHPNQGGSWNPDFSDTDIKYNIANKVSEYVISRKSVYRHIHTMGNLTTNLGSNRLFNPYIYNPWWINYSKFKN